MTEQPILRNLIGGEHVDSAGCRADLVDATDLLANRPDTTPETQP